MQLANFSKLLITCTDWHYRTRQRTRNKSPVALINVGMELFTQMAAINVSEHSDPGCSREQISTVRGWWLGVPSFHPHFLL
jgi:hypothetical protein